MTEAPSYPPSSRRGPREGYTSAARRRRRALLAGVAVLVLVLIVAGVAVATRGDSEPAADVVARGFAPGGDLKTAQVNAKLGLTGSAAAGGEPLIIEFAGPYSAGDVKTTRFRFDIAVNGGSASSEPVASLIGAGGKSYIQVASQAFELSDKVLDDLKAEEDKSKGRLSFSSLGIDPGTWLEDPKIVGDEQWSGESVTHVRATVDTDRLASDLEKVVTRADKASGAATDAKAAAATLNTMKKDVTSTRIDVWVAKGKGALRRLQVDIKLKSGRIALDFSLSKVNEPVKIATPKNALPFEQLLSVFAGASSEKGGTGTTTTPAPSGGATTTPDTSTDGSSDAYTQCVDAAGSDVSKLQACAKLSK